MNKNEIIKVFDLADLSPISEKQDILVDLISDWENDDSYKIIVDKNIREIDGYKVSKCGLIMFIDQTSKQTTILDLKNYKGKESYRYKNKGKVKQYFSFGRFSASVIVFDENIVYKEVTKKGKGRKSTYKTEITEYEKNKINLKNACERYEKYKKSILN